MSTGPQTILKRLTSEAAAGASSVGVEFSTDFYNALAFDYTVAAFTGGTTPDISFFIDRRGADGLWYRVWTSVAHTAAESRSIHLLPAGVTVAAAADIPGISHVVLGARARLGWVFAGAVPATSIKFSYSLIGRTI